MPRAVPASQTPTPVPQHPQPARRTEHPQSTDASPAITRAFALLSSRWNGLILMALAKGPADFAQIRERLPGISNRMLAQRLQELTVIDLVAQDVRPWAVIANPLRTLPTARPPSHPPGRSVPGGRKITFQRAAHHQINRPRQVT